MYINRECTEKRQFIALVVSTTHRSKGARSAVACSASWSVFKGFDGIRPEDGAVETSSVQVSVVLGDDILHEGTRLSR